MHELMILLLTLTKKGMKTYSLLAWSLINSSIRVGETEYDTPLS